MTSTCVSRCLAASGVAFALVSLAACKERERTPEQLGTVFEGRAASAAPLGSAPSPWGRAVPSASASASASASSSAAAPSDPAQLALDLSAKRRPRVPGPCVEAAGEPASVGERPGKRPACRGAEVLEERAPDGTPRYACLSAPPRLEERTPLPLVVFFHGENDNPGMVSRATRLRELDDEVDLSGDPKRRGFIVLAPQARRIGHRLAFDTGHVARENTDAVMTDRFVDVLVRRGFVNEAQIYAIGASRGGEMAALWAMLRPDRVAAFAAYGATAQRLRWSCADLEPTPAAIVYRACDGVTSCLDVEQWLHARDGARAPTLALRLGDGTRAEPSCALSETSCKEARSVANHERWPKGRERDMLEFLGRYSLR